MIPKKGPGPDFKPIQEHLKNILSLKLMTSTTNLLEKTFWFLIAFCGTIYITYIVASQFSYWEQNPDLKTRDVISISQLKQPAITFCHKGVQKYSVVERMLNHIDANKTIPMTIYEFRNEVIKAKARQLESTSGVGRGKEFCKLSKDSNGQWTVDNPVNPNEDLERDCHEFSKNIYVIGKKFKIDIPKISEIIFDLISEVGMWNLTDGFLKIEELFGSAAFKLKLGNVSNLSKSFENYVKDESDYDLGNPSLFFSCIGTY